MKFWLSVKKLGRARNELCSGLGLEDTLLNGKKGNIKGTTTYR
jgi:hypothetical protein